MADGDLTFEAQSSLSFAPVYTSENALGNGVDNQRVQYNETTATGIGDNQADRYFKLSTNTGSTTSIDLAATQVDLFGNTTTFADVSGILIKNLSPTAGENLHVGDKSGGATAFAALFVVSTDTIVIHPKGIFYITAPLGGYVVGSGSTDILYIAAATGTISFEIRIWGHSSQ